MLVVFLSSTDSLGDLLSVWLCSSKVKMKWLIAGLLGVATLYFVMESGFALKCYKCNSYFQQDCSDWFNNKTFNLDDCASDETLCRKIVQEVYYNDEWNVRYIRQCAKAGTVGDDEGRQCLERTGTYRVKMRYCHCNNQDGCNGATSANLPITMLLLPALTTLWLLFKKL